ncbi:MAG TPA: gamma-glutamylcyclotransferase family protein [Bryobacteraceae bacterium]|nr:gamma-glutamylcyclotransferase family protein [Bryobacteraceae bacterium]
MLDLLFVYGTLRSEFDNRYARLLREDATLIGKSTVRGSIYRVRHFPAFRAGFEGEVRGELYRLHQPEATLKALDDYEGEEFERVIVNHSWIYQYKVQPPQNSRIASGDFCAQ